MVGGLYIFYLEYCLLSLGLIEGEEKKMKTNECKKCPYLYNNEYCICHKIYTEDDECDVCWEGLKEHNLDYIEINNVFMEKE